MLSAGVGEGQSGCPLPRALKVCPGSLQVQGAQVSESFPCTAQELTQKVDEAQAKLLRLLPACGATQRQRWGGPCRAGAQRACEHPGCQCNRSRVRAHRPAASAERSVGHPPCGGRLRNSNMLCQPRWQRHRPGSAPRRHRLSHSLSLSLSVIPSHLDLH
jgi:hypothetical protein